MQTVDFLNAVLPRSGLRYLAVPGLKGWRHVPLPNNELLAANAVKVDARGGNVYFACASFKDNSGRKQTNVAAVRAFWLDIDCGDGKPYADKKLGYVALKQFLADTGLPSPLIVDSGNGLHVYWPLTEDLDEPAWKVTAELLKQATKKNGIKVDHSRTADSASVLRPVGTTNRKRDPKPVRALNEVSGIDPADMAQHLQTYLGVTRAQVLLVGNRPTTAFALNSDLTAGVEYRPSYAKHIADKCGVIGLMRDTRGNVDQPTWYHSLGVLAKTAEGRDICHEWSNGHPDYSERETDSVIARVSQHGPTTCAKLQDHQPDICAACPFSGKIKSPIVLGYEDPKEPEEQTITAPDPEDATKDVEIKLPKPFRENAGKLEVAIKDKEADAIEYITVTDSFFLPINRIKTPPNMRSDMQGSTPGMVDESESDYTLEIEMQVKGRDQRRRFKLPMGLIGSGGSELFDALAKKEIVARDKMKPQMAQYLSAWVSKLRQEAEEIKTCSNFGWHGDSFVIGRRMFSPGGIERRAIMAGNAVGKAGLMEPVGSLDKWVEAANIAYNYEGQEGYQFALLCGFAAPLFGMLRDPGGVTVYIHSEGSGHGKSTVSEAAMSVWGHPKRLTTNDNKTTSNALWINLGVHHSLPYVFDELTNLLPDVASQTVYSISDGRPRERSDSAGLLRDNNAEWGTIVIAAGNNLLTEKLTAHRANAEAEVARVFEYTLRAPIIHDPTAAERIFNQINENYGHAGRVFMRYVVDNKPKLIRALRMVKEQFVKDADIRREDRYWADLCASVIVSLKICNKLDLLQYNSHMMQRWLVATVADNRVQRVFAATDPLDVFGRMLTELWNGVLVTVGEGDARSKPCPVVTKPVGKLTGRVILENAETHDRPYLYINASSARDWCARHGVSAKEVLGACVREGWAAPHMVRYSLGKGSAEYATQSSHVNCWQLDPHKMSAATGGSGVGNFIHGVVLGMNSATSTGSV